MSRFDLSVIIPVYNRGELIRYTLESVRRASDGLRIETVIVDDGSLEPAADTLARLGYTPEARVIRQENRGLLLARLAGLHAAQGQHVLFLDSDDLVSREKFRAQLTVMNQSGADISYSDTARATLAGHYDALQPMADAPSIPTADVAEFCITVQPAPHAPIFRTNWLRQVVSEALFPPLPLYNPVAEIWFYHNAAIRAGRVVHVPGPHSIIGLHPGVRLTNHWEKLGVASLAVMEAFARTCPASPDTGRARRLAGEKAFRAWRGLPRDFAPEFGDRLLRLWRTLAPGRSAALGGRGFVALARLVGPEQAARWLQRFQNPRYEACRTLDPAELTALLARLPRP